MHARPPACTHTAAVQLPTGLKFKEKCISPLLLQTFGQHDCGMLLAIASALQFLQQNRLLTASWAAAQVRWVMEAGEYRPPPGSHVWGSLMMACGKAGHGAAVGALWREASAALPAPPPNLLHAYMHACNTCSQVAPASALEAPTAESPAAHRMRCRPARNPSCGGAYTAADRGIRSNPGPMAPVVLPIRVSPGRFPAAGSPNRLSAYRSGCTAAVMLPPEEGVPLWLSEFSAQSAPRSDSRILGGRHGHEDGNLAWNRRTPE